MSIAVVESSADQRRHAREEATARQLVATLERQAREIVEAAAATEQDDTVRGFAHYRAFRRKVVEFESLCSVIETSLRKLADAPRGVLNQLLHTRRDMILGPSIRAMTAFFTRLAAGGALPLGVFDILETELQVLAGMREELDAAAALLPDDAETRAQIDKLEGIIGGLRGKATQFDDFSELAVVTAGLPPEDVLPEKAAAVPTSVADEPKRRDTPQLRAVRDIRELLEPRRTDHALGQNAEIDLRALDDIERRLTSNPDDAGAIKWLRRLCNAWSSRIRGKEHVFLRIAKGIG